MITILNIVITMPYTRDSTMVARVKYIVKIKENCLIRKEKARIRRQTLQLIVTCPKAVDINTFCWIEIRIEAILENEITTGALSALIKAVTKKGIGVWELWL